MAVCPTSRLRLPVVRYRGSLGFAEEACEFEIRELSVNGGIGLKYKENDPGSDAETPEPGPVR